MLFRSIGMDQYVIDKYYTNIGYSFYKSSDFYDLRSKTNTNFTPTSRFGIGILSCFMIADTMEVDTRKIYEPHKSSDPLNLSVEGYDSIFWIKRGNRSMPGTSTKLKLRRKSNPWEKLSDDEFITAVEEVIPNPPFKISIETNSKVIERNEHSFERIEVTELTHIQWDEHEHIRQLAFKINKPEDGIIASVHIALLESKKHPKNIVHLKSRKIKIENEFYELERSIMTSLNEINETSTSITIDDDGDIDSSTTKSQLAKSASRISLHGIEIPTTLFPPIWEKRNYPVSINWPFPALLIVDICGTRDIDLNSARNQILHTSNWIEFEELLTNCILRKIKNEVGDIYWSELAELFMESKNETFLRCLAGA